MSHDAVINNWGSGVWGHHAAAMEPQGTALAASVFSTAAQVISILPQRILTCTCCFCCVSAVRAADGWCTAEQGWRCCSWGVAGRGPLCSLAAAAPAEAGAGAGLHTKGDHHTMALWVAVISVPVVLMPNQESVLEPLKAAMLSLSAVS